MSHEEKVRARLEANRAKLESFEQTGIQRFGGVAHPIMIENELRRQIAVDEEILQTYC